MSSVGAFGILLAVALVSMASGRLIVAAFRLRRLLRFDPTSAAASTVLGSVAVLLAAARLSELGLVARRILIVVAAVHGLLIAVTLLRRTGGAFRPVGPAAAWAALLAVVLLAALTGLLSLPLTGGFGLGYDNFIYCSAGEWLQDHAFSEPAESSTLAPVASVVRSWQLGTVGLGASYFLALLAAAGSNSALVAYPVASTWGLVLSALTILVAARWALHLPTAWAFGAAFNFALLPHPASWAHHNGFFAQTYGIPGLVLGLAAMALPPRRGDPTGAVLVGLAAAYTLTVYVPFLGLLGAAGAAWLAGLLRLRRDGGAAPRAWPAIGAVLLFLGAAGLDLRPVYRLLPSLVTALVGGPVRLSPAEWLAFAMGTRAYLAGRAFLDVSPALSVAAALAAAVLAAAGVFVAAPRRPPRGLLVAVAVLAGLIVWYAGFAPDPWTGGIGHTWSVFKAVNWAYPLVLLLQAAGAARLGRSLGRAAAALLCPVVLTLASVQVAWARGFGLTMRKAVATESPLRDAARIKDRFRAMPAGRVVLLGRPASVSPWLAVYTALFAYPRPIALDWEDSAGQPAPLAPVTAAYRALLERLHEPDLVSVALGVEGLSDARVEPLGGAYLRLLEPVRPQLAQVLAPEGVMRDRESGRPFFRLGSNRAKLVFIAPEPCAVRVILEPLGSSPLPLQTAIQVVPDEVGGPAFREAIRAAPLREVMAPAGGPVEIDVALGRGQTTVALRLRAASGTARELRVARVGVRSLGPERRKGL